MIVPMFSFRKVATAVMANRTILACGLLGIYIVAGISYFAMSASERGRNLVWYTDLGTASRRAVAANKRLLLDFSAIWCGPCRSMKTITFADASVVRALEKYVVVSIDVDAHSELARDLDVETIPQFFVVDPSSGKVLKENRIGFMPPEDFLAWLNGNTDGTLSESLPTVNDQSLATTK
jgi:thiol:disulfide interchange protein